MAKPDDRFVLDVLIQAHARGRLVLRTDPRIHARPGSPVYDAVDVFVPPMTFLASSLTMLFAFGPLEWIGSLTAVLLYQIFLAPRVISWRCHRRAVRAIITNPHNLAILWRHGGITMMVKGQPEHRCDAPNGDWRGFVAAHLVEERPPASLESPV
jgi:hypothetical protein